MLLPIVNNSLILYSIVLSLLLIAIEIISRIENNNLKKIILILLSCTLICFLDYASFALLMVFSGIVWSIIYYRIPIKPYSGLLVFFLILLLILIKNYSLVLPIKNPYLPLGISFYFFRLISVLIDYGQKSDEFEDISFLHFLTYVTFFPLFLAGPLQRFVQFHETEELIGSEKNKNYCDILISFAIKVFVVDFLLYRFTYEFLKPLLSPALQNSSLFLISLFGVTAFLHAYIDLMIYTRISNAASRIMGFSYQINFNMPLLASNISQFWQRWHISLSSWVRDYVYFPLVVKTKKIWIGTYGAMMIIALWHSAKPGWIVWGLAHGTALTLYGLLRNSSIYIKLNKTTLGKNFLRITGNIVTIYFVSIIFVFLAYDNFNEVLLVFKKAFGIIK